MAGLELTFADETCAEALADEKLLAAMARFESALALASAQAGLISQADAQTIARVCAEFRPDAGALARPARTAGTLAIPFVDELSAQVRRGSPSAAVVVHGGAASQDVMDSGLVLGVRPACTRIAE